MILIKIIIYNNNNNNYYIKENFSLFYLFILIRNKQIKEKKNKIHSNLFVNKIIIISCYLILVLFYIRKQKKSKSISSYYTNKKFSFFLLTNLNIIN